jgi:hypothetical protein
VNLNSGEIKKDITNVGTRGLEDYPVGVGAWAISGGGWDFA